MDYLSAFLYSYSIYLQLDSPLDHLFSTSQVTIMQSCDLCGSYIWVMEKAYMCSGEHKRTDTINVHLFKHSKLLFYHFSLQVNLSQEMFEQNHHRLLNAARQPGENSWFDFNK